MGRAADYVSRTKIGAYFHETRESRKLVLLIVAIALLLDNMLLTTVGESDGIFRRSAISPKIQVSRKNRICFDSSQIYVMHRRDNTVDVAVLLEAALGSFCSSRRIK